MSDDEADNEVDLGTFNMGLISLPEESVSPPAPSSSDKDAKPSFVDNGTSFFVKCFISLSCCRYNVCRRHQGRNQQ